MQACILGDPGAVLVIGFGLTGQSVKRYLDSRGFTVLVYDDADVVLPSMERVTLDSSWPNFKFSVLSPGFKSNHPVIQQLRRMAVPVYSDLDIFSCMTDVPIIAVTGSNGKTTVTTWLARALISEGIKAVACGNIGRPVLDALNQGSCDCWVVELSSFQLDICHSFTAQWGVILNITEDHLDHYGGSFERYRQSKLKMLSIASKVYVHHGLKGHLSPQIAYQTFGQDHGADWTFRHEEHGQVLCYKTHPVAHINTPLFCFQVDNYLAVWSVLSAWGFTSKQLMSMMGDYPGLAHRLEVICEAPVMWVNDSKSTNPASTLGALGYFRHCKRPIILMLGGESKGADLSVLLPQIKVSCVCVIAYGQSKKVIHQLFHRHLPVHVVDVLPQAVQLATSLAKYHYIVLFSPACSSLDQFKNYQQRGDEFRTLANNLRS